MKIKEILSSGRPSLSFEVFPPKADASFEPIRAAVARLASQRPSFMSVTYGASGNAQANTAEVATFVQSLGVPALAHLTCVAASRESIRAEVAALADAGVANVLALRGDVPPGMEFPGGSDFRHAADLVRYLKEISPDLCLGGACYPEGHPESAHLRDDIAHLREKVDAGLDFLTTQMFFDNNILYAYLAKIRAAGIQVPVVAGVMPVTNARQITRICRLSGTLLPPRFRAIVDRFGDDPASLRAAGIAHATGQIVDLIANGVDNVHIYTMNKPDVAGRIVENLRAILA